MTDRRQIPNDKIPALVNPKMVKWAYKAQGLRPPSDDFIATLTLTQARNLARAADVWLSLFYIGDPTPGWRRELRARRWNRSKIRRWLGLKAKKTYAIPPNQGKEYGSKFVSIPKDRKYPITHDVD